MKSTVSVKVGPKCKRGSNPAKDNITEKRLSKGVFLPDDIEIQDDACSVRPDLMNSQLGEDFRGASWVAEDESKTSASSEGDFALMNFATDFDNGGNYMENGCSIEIQYLLGAQADNQGTLSEKESESLFVENGDEENFSTEVEAARVLKLCALNSWHSSNHEGGVDVLSSTIDEDWFIESLNDD